MTTELFERIQGLPFENLTEDDCDELLDGLKAKELPEGDEALSTLAEDLRTAMGRFTVSGSGVKEQEAQRE